MRCYASNRVYTHDLRWRRHGDDDNCLCERWNERYAERDMARFIRDADDDDVTLCLSVMRHTSCDDIRATAIYYVIMSAARYEDMPLRVAMIRERRCYARLVDEYAIINAAAKIIIAID